MNTKPLDLDLLAEAGSDSFALERAMHENDHRERAALHEAASIAENESLLYDAGYSLQWQPIQRIGRAEVHTVRAFRSGRDPRGHAVYAGCACSRLRALQHLLDQRPDGVSHPEPDPEPGDDLSGWIHEEALDRRTEVPTRYSLNVDSWLNQDYVIERTLRDMLAHIESEVDTMDDGETCVFTVTCVRKSDEEMDALPEWDGP